MTSLVRFALDAQPPPCHTFDVRKKYMRNFLLAVFILGLIGVGLYFGLQYIKNEGPPKEPLARLSYYIDNYVDEVLSPLSGGSQPIPTHELRMLKEQFKDNNATGTHQPTTTFYAIRLCDVLLSAIESREKHIQRLESALAISHSPFIKNPVDAERDRQRRREFFSDGVNRSWMQETQRIRSRIDIDYSQLRKLERISLTE